MRRVALRRKASTVQCIRRFDRCAASLAVILGAAISDLYVVYDSGIQVRDPVGIRADINALPASDFPKPLETSTVHVPGIGNPTSRGPPDTSRRREEQRMI